MTKLLVAASGTGGHLFPALAVVQQLKEYQIEWLGVPDRLEQTLVPDHYPLHTISVAGFQKGFSFNSLAIFQRLIGSIFEVQQLIKQLNIDVVLTTGGYIAAPAIIAAKWQKIPVLLHESNALPGKVTRWFSPWCTTCALGFQDAAQHLPRARNTWVGTPVREDFLRPQALDLPIPEDAPLIVVVGGSQGAVAVNNMVRYCAPAWFEEGIYLVHLTGDRDPQAQSLQHPQYFPMPFYENMAGLLQRADLAISRAGAGTLTELAISHTPAILIPYPYAAEDHQAYNAKVFDDAGAAIVELQESLDPQILKTKVLDLLRSRATLSQMAQQAASLAVVDSAERLADLVRELVEE